MREITMFVEDFAHEEFLKTLVRRVADEYGIPIELKFRSATGGFGKVLAELRQYIQDVKRGLDFHPHLLIVGIDGNCKGYLARRRDVEQIMEGYSGAYICAIPDSHIERWMLLDSAAFKLVFGRGCPAPPKKCERDLFKGKLLQAILEAGARPILGGVEYAESIVQNLDLEFVERADQSLRRFLDELRSKFNEWQ